jgi:DNA topoisomerase VI subunit B
MPKQKSPKPLARLERTTFTQSRELEYFSPEELTKQIGHEFDLWPIAITKELIDNALDACEAIPVQPQIIVTVDGDRISVADNANGLPEATFRASQDYSVTVSDKTHYKSPLRGRQGNALKTVWAAPFVFNGGCEGGGQGRVEVVTPSYAYEVVASLNRIAQKPQITMTALDQPFVKTGTIVTIAWQRQVSSDLDDDEETDEKPDFYKTVLELLQSYALFNPHAGFTLCSNGQAVEVAKPLIEGWRKWLPSDPTSPHWYTVETLTNLIGAKIYNGHERQTIREFVSEFSGLTSTLRQKRIVAAADLDRLRLENLKTQDGTAINTTAVEQLLKAMCAESKPVKAEKLGLIGEEALTKRLIEIEGVNAESVRYGKLFNEGPEPAVMEMAWGIRDAQNLPASLKDDDLEFDQTDGRCLRYGLNFAPTIKCPFAYVPHRLQRLMIESTDPICMVMHAASAHIQFSDRGKAMVSGGEE